VKHYHFYDLADADVLQSLGSMEGELPPAAPAPGSIWAGFLAATALTLASWGLMHLPFPPFTTGGGLHPVGFSSLAMLGGKIGASIFTVPAAWLTGLRWTANTLIPIAIVLLGALIDTRVLSQISPSMWAGVPLLMAIAFLATFGLGRLFGLARTPSALLAVGTAVCGSSAILALAPILRAKKDDIVLTVSAINLAGLLAMLVGLGLLQVIPLESSPFGYWMGASMQAVPQAIAVADSHGPEAAAIATTTKLLRVLFLAPIVILAGLWLARSSSLHAANSKTRWLSHVPWFVWGFAIMIALRSFGLLPHLEFEPSGYRIGTVDLFSHGSKWLLAISLAAIGLQIRIGSLLRQNSGALAVFTTAFCGWLIVSSAAFLVAILTH
jgi:uncharacterized integral membrane protein (TIGR00698 family)